MSVGGDQNFLSKVRAWQAGSHTEYRLREALCQLVENSYECQVLTTASDRDRQEFDEYDMLMAAIWQRAVEALEATENERDGVREGFGCPTSGPQGSGEAGRGDGEGVGGPF